MENLLGLIKQVLKSGQARHIGGPIASAAYAW